MFQVWTIVLYFIILSVTILHCIRVMNILQVFSWKYIYNIYTLIVLESTPSQSLIYICLSILYLSLLKQINNDRFYIKKWTWNEIAILYSIPLLMFGDFFRNWNCNSLEPTIPTLKGIVILTLRKQNHDFIPLLLIVSTLITFLSYYRFIIYTYCQEQF